MVAGWVKISFCNHDAIGVSYVAAHIEVVVAGHKRGEVRGGGALEDDEGMCWIGDGVALRDEARDEVLETTV